MVANSQILYANVMHKRLFPKENGFNYKVYYLAFDIDRVEELADGRWFGLERLGLASFHSRDHGACDGSSISRWAWELVNRHVPRDSVRKIILVAMPRVLGYGFNPVSFWLCLDGEDTLKAVICEVHNTFGERHVYLCRSETGESLDRSTALEAWKTFHVSPFIERNGHYKFRFQFDSSRLGVWIDYYNREGRRQLATSLTGGFVMNIRRERLAAFVKCPLVTLKTITMIHWQALRLFMKGIRYVPRPAQLARRLVTAGRKRAPETATPAEVKISTEKEIQERKQHVGEVC